MIAIIVLGWIGVVLVLTSYLLSHKLGYHQYNWANVICAPLVALPSLWAHVWSAAAISLAFGAIGTYKLIKGAHANHLKG